METKELSAKEFWLALEKSGLYETIGVRVDDEGSRVNLERAIWAELVWVGRYSPNVASESPFKRKSPEEWIFIDRESLGRKIASIFARNDEADMKRGAEIVLRLLEDICGDKKVICQFRGYVYRVAGGFRFEQHPSR